MCAKLKTGAAISHWINASWRFVEIGFSSLYVAWVVINPFKKSKRVLCLSFDFLPVASNIYMKGILVKGNSTVRQKHFNIEHLKSIFTFCNFKPSQLFKGFLSSYGSSSLANPPIPRHEINENIDYGKSDFIKCK